LFIVHFISNEPILQNKTETKKPQQQKMDASEKTMKWLAAIPDRVDEMVVQPFDEMVVQPLQDLVKDVTDATNTNLTTSGKREPKTESTREKKENNGRVPIVAHIVTVESSLRGGTELRLADSSNRMSNIMSIKHVNKKQQKLQEPPQGDQEMTFRLLRGKNLPTEKFQLTIYQFDGNNVNHQDDLDVIGVVHGRGDIDHPTIIWGGSSNRWSLKSNQQKTLVFQLSYESNSLDSPSKTKRCTKQVSWILPRKYRHPNIWIRFDNDDDNDHDEVQIQVHLGFKQSWNIHPQENCPRLGAGPGLSAPFTSYRLRKEVLWSCCPVMLNVYDVSNNPKVETINQYTKAVGAGGIFHAAIELNGIEYSFGGTSNRRSRMTGVFSCPPKKCPMHHYRESIYLGDCELDPVQISAILAELKPQWLANSYNLFRKNCCFFSQELAIELGVGDIPAWVYLLATTAEFIEPHLIKLNQYLIARAQAKRASKEKAKTADNVNKTEPAHTEDVTLDHAMAARIQRSFRRK
jgi:hypothetical protein